MPFVLILLTISAFAQQQPSRQQLYQALTKAKALGPDRMLVHFSHTCDLRIANRLHPVVEIRELVKGASTPRGVNRIIILSPSLAILQAFDYTNERPLFCSGSKLYLYSDITIDGVQGEGNVIDVAPQLKDWKLSHVDPNDLPVPVTRLRKASPQ